MAHATTARVGRNFQIVIPRELRKAAKLRVGDFLHAELRREGILLTPAAIKVSTFRDELERHLGESEADRRAGRVYGPFDTAAELVESLHEHSKRPRKRAPRRA